MDFPVFSCQAIRTLHMFNHTDQQFAKGYRNGSDAQFDSDAVAQLQALYVWNASLISSIEECALFDDGLMARALVTSGATIAGSSDRIT